MEIYIERKNELEELETLFIPKEISHYKCFDELRCLLRNNEDFKVMLAMGYNAGKVSGFRKDDWNKIKNYEVMTGCSLDVLFEEDFNIRHSDIFVQNIISMYPGGKIIDTSLMLVIDEDYAKRLGYKEHSHFMDKDASDKTGEGIQKKK